MIYVSQDKNKPIPGKSFHDSFNFLIKVANGLGLLPLNGLSSVAEIKFQWRSFKTIYTILATAIFVANTIICMINWTSVRFNFRVLGKPNFWRNLGLFGFLVRQINQINAFTCMILYLRLAKKWPKFSRLWDEVDRKMSKVYGYPKNLDFRIRLLSIIALILSFGRCHKYENKL